MSNQLPTPDAVTKYGAEFDLPVVSEERLRDELAKFMSTRQGTGDPSGFTISGGSGNDPSCTCCND